MEAPWGGIGKRVGHSRDGCRDRGGFRTEVFREVVAGWEGGER